MTEIPLQALNEKLERLIEAVSRLAPAQAPAADFAAADCFVWDAEHLDQWLAKPREYLPGTKMSFAGVKNEKDRIDLIAYLKVETGYQP